MATFTLSEKSGNDWPDFDNMTCEVATVKMKEWTKYKIINKHLVLFGDLVFSILFRITIVCIVLVVLGLRQYYFIIKIKLYDL